MIKRRHTLIARVLLISAFSFVFGGVFAAGAGFPGRYERLSEASSMVDRLSQPAEHALPDAIRARVLEMKHRYEELAHTESRSIAACWGATAWFLAFGAFLGFLGSRSAEAQANLRLHRTGADAPAAEPQPRWADRLSSSEGTD